MISIQRTSNNSRISAYRLTLGPATRYDIVVSEQGVEIYRVSRSKCPACGVFDTIPQARDNYKGKMRKALAALEDYSAAGESEPLCLH